MTEVKLKHNKNEYAIVIKGHAESGPKGHDIVCAGISTLTFALTQTLQDLHSSGKLNKFGYIHKTGHAEIKCKPESPEIELEVSVIFKTIMNGFTLLEDSWPENISVSISPLG